MSGRRGVTSSESSAVASAGRLRALGAALAEAKRRVGEGAEIDLGPLHLAVVEALGSLRGGAISSDSGTGLLVLLDEAVALVARLELERDSLSERGRAWVRRRRAGISYLTSGRRP